MAPPSAEHVQEYMALGTSVPPALLHKAIAPRTTEDTCILAQSYLGEDRVGPANVHNNDPDALLARAVAGVDAEPPVPEALKSNTSTAKDDMKGRLIRA